MSARPSLSRIGSLMQYIRMGFSNYLAFILSPLTFLNVLYVALSVQGVNLNYWLFISISLPAGIIILFGIGYAHYKAGLYAGQTNVDVLNHPWYKKAIPGKEKDVALPITLLSLELMTHLLSSQNLLTNTDKYRIQQARDQLQALINGESV